MRTTALLIFLAFFASNLLGQGTKGISNSEFLTIFKNSTGSYGDYYQLVYRQEVFMNPIDQQPYSQASGIFKKGKDLEYINDLNGELTIQTASIKMVLDSTEQAIYLVQPDTLFKPSLFTEDLFTTAFTEIIEITVQTGKLANTYRITFTDPSTEYEFIELELNEKVKQLQKITIQFREGNFYSEELEDRTLEKPLVVIQYEPIQKGKLNARDFDIQHYILEKNGTYELASHFNQYMLHDLRYTE